MLKRHLLLASVLAGTFAITACSQQTEDQADAGNVEAAAESAGDDIAANTQAATNEAEAAAQNAGETLADNAQTAGAVAVNAGEAIADGANQAVASTADAVAKGADSVADSAATVAADADAKPDTDLQAPDAIKDSVSEDQNY